MAPVIHPGRLLKREMAARNLSANRLRWISAFRPAALLIFSIFVERSPLTRRYGLGAILAIALSSGSICKGSMTSA
jgi:hypothetical protein